VKRRDLERHLRQHGCRFIGEGSRHREVKPGTVRAICRPLEVPVPSSVHRADGPGGYNVRQV
jgi:hypothetical protein